ncbi:MAG: hypothetical protein WCV71_01255 [Patescibacteria group bacterium]
MKKSLLILFIFPLLIGAACTSKDVQKSEELNTNEEPKLEEKQVVEENIIEPSNQTYTLYENKAIGYKVLRPDGWYWRHFMKADLKTAGVNELIDDYLIIDKNIIKGLGSEYLGEIVIGKSRMNLEELAKQKNGYSTREATVAGLAATRFEIQTSEDNLFPNRKIVEYHLLKNDETFVLSYMSSDDKTGEAIFEKVVASFSFVK